MFNRNLTVIPWLEEPELNGNTDRMKHVLGLFLFLYKNEDALDQRKQRPATSLHGGYTYIHMHYTTLKNKQWVFMGKLAPEPVSSFFAITHDEVKFEVSDMVRSGTRERRAVRTKMKLAWIAPRDAGYSFWPACFHCSDLRYSGSLCASSTVRGRPSGPWLPKANFTFNSGKLDSTKKKVTHSGVFYEAMVITQLLPD